MSNNKSVSNPIHAHDCDCCTFYGNYVFQQVGFDLYHCPRHDELIARYGEAGEYMASEVKLTMKLDASHPLEQAHALHKLNQQMEEKAITEFAEEQT